MKQRQEKDAEGGEGRAGIVEQALIAHLDPTNRTARAEEVSEPEKRLLDRLLGILRSQNNEAIRAVTANINLFHDYCRLKDKPD